MVRPAAEFRGAGGFLRSICGWVWGRVLFSESPPLKRKDSGQPPSEWPENGSLVGVPDAGGGGF
jgi:hypothetical protein